MHRTPAHAVAQAMLAEHQYGICCRLLLESWSHLRHSMIAIEPDGPFVHHIAQISEFRLWKRMMGFGHRNDFLTVVHAPGSQQLLYGFPTEFGQLRGGNKPIVTQFHINAFCLEGCVAQLGQLVLDVIGLRRAGQFLFFLQCDADAYIVLIG